MPPNRLGDEENFETSMLVGARKINPSRSPIRKVKGVSRVTLTAINFDKHYHSICQESSLIYQDAITQHMPCRSKKEYWHML
jgi:hypothetical protein